MESSISTSEITKLRVIIQTDRVETFKFEKSSVYVLHTLERE